MEGLEARLSALSVKQLKAELAARCIDTTGLAERKELVDALLQHGAAAAAAPPSTSSSAAPAAPAVMPAAAPLTKKDAERHWLTHDEHKCASCDAARRADGEELSTCAGCHVVHYCSPPCQRADWPRHKHECKDMLAQTSLNKAYVFKEGAAATQARRGREPAASLGELLREAERGDAHAQYRYADACGGAEQLRWLNKSAAQGHRGALLKLGVIFQFGQGVPRSLVKAAEYFEKSIAAGEPSAYSNLGILYQKGEGGVPLDNEKAVALYREGARLGHMTAKMMLAQALFNGIGVESADPVEAVRLASEASGMGQHDATYLVGCAWMQGRGVPRRDEDRAIAFFEKAVAGGHATSMHSLAILLLQRAGPGTPDESRKHAISLLRKAAAAGVQAAVEAVTQLDTKGSIILKVRL